MPERARMALLGAAVLTALLVATWFAAFHVGFAAHADQSILNGFGGLGTRPRVGTLANFIARLCDPNPWVYFCALPIGMALARRRRWVAVAIVAILLGANVTTQLLKPLLAVQHPFTAPGTINQTLPGSWPSGHATAAMSLALCCVLAAPARLRPFFAAMGAAFAVAVSYSFLTLEWHYPSDVLGGFLIAGIWTLLGVAGVFTAGARGVSAVPAGRQPRLSVREILGPPSAALLAALGLAALVVIARPHQVVSYARVHEAFIVGAVAIGVLGMALATGLVLALRR